MISKDKAMKSPALRRIRRKLQNRSNGKKAKILQKFFKTGPGEYAEGDVFCGCTVPEIRKIAREHLNIGLNEAAKLLRSRVHEERLLALLIFVLRYPKASDEEKNKIHGLYLKNTKYINNWDLVDLSAAHIVGAHLNGKSKKPLYLLTKSRSLWERRIAIISTFYYIRNHRFGDALRISEKLLSDREDLIHKAVGWMLREVGKRDLTVEEKFLKKHHAGMPRTMLRYAIEKFPESKRLLYLKGLP